VKNFSSAQKLQIGIIFAVPIVFFVCFLFVDTLVFISQLSGPCRLYATTGILCPGCGATRSMSALFAGEFSRSLRCNPLVIFSCVVGGGFYLEILLNFFGKTKKIVPRNKFFVIGTLVSFFVFYVARLFFPFLAPPM